MDTVSQHDLWESIGTFTWLAIVTYFGVCVIAIAWQIIRSNNTKRPRFLTLSRFFDEVKNAEQAANVAIAYQAFRVITNLIVCSLYVYSTYVFTVTPVVAILNRIFASIFTLEIVLRLLYSPMATSYVFSLSSFLSVCSIPSLFLASGPTAFLHYGFLRAFPAYDAYKALERRFVENRTDPKNIFIRLFLQFLTLFYVLAAGIQMLEIPGDWLRQEFLQRWGEVGDWNFFNCLYYVTVTLSTVGYGDLSPSTIQGRVYTIFMIIVGIIVFSNIVDELKNDTKRQRGVGRYRPNKDKRHVIVSGTPTIEEFQHFVKEFYWGDSSYLNKDSIIVVMVENAKWDDDTWYSQIATDLFLQSHIIYLKGSVKDPADLERAGIYSANAFFILTSPSLGDNFDNNANSDGSRRVQQADTQTVMYSLAVRNVRTDIPIFAQTLLNDSNIQIEFALRAESSMNLFHRPSTDTAASYKHFYSTVLEEEERCLTKDVLDRRGVTFADLPRTPSRNEVAGFDLERSNHVCLQELYSAMIVANINANGVCTLVTNLHIEFDNKYENYYSDLKKPWMVEYNMGAETSLLNAIIPKRLDGLHIRDLAPLLYRKGLVIVGTRGKTDLETKMVLDLNSEDAVLKGGDICLFLTYLHMQHIGFALDQLANEIEAYGIPKPENLPISRYKAILSNIENRPEPTVNHNDLNNNQEDENPEYLHFDTVSETVRDVQSGRDQLSEWKDHIIIAMEGGTPLDQLLYFLKQLQMTDKDIVRVVVIYPLHCAEDRARFRSLKPRIQICFIDGKPAAKSSWIEANIMNARAVVTLADYTRERENADAQTIYTLLALDSISNLKKDLFICSEFIQEGSIELLRQPSFARRRGVKLGISLESHDVIGYNNSGDHSVDTANAGDIGSVGKMAKRDFLFQRHRYASGELLAHSTADSLLVREYAEPGFMHFIMDLFGARLRNDSQKIQLMRIPSELFEQPNGVELIEGKRYIVYEVLFGLLVCAGITPLGLYRSGDAKLKRNKCKRWKRGDAIQNESMRNSSMAGCFRFRNRIARKFQDARPVNQQFEKGRKDFLQSNPNSNRSHFRPKEDNEYEYGGQLVDAENILPYVYTLPEPSALVSERDAVYVLCNPGTRFKAG